MKKLLLVGVLLLLGSCGFHLKGMGESALLLPYENWLVKNGQGIQTELVAELKQQVIVVDTDADNVATLEIQEFLTQRDIQTINRVGTVNEYLLILKVVAQVYYQSEPVGQPIIVVSERNYSYSHDILGKAEEEELIWENMRQDVATRIVRRLGHLPKATPTPKIKPESTLDR